MWPHFLLATYKLNAKTKLGKRHNYGFGWLPKTSKLTGQPTIQLALLNKVLFPYKLTY
jgi:hypothetical protein